jgi:hypothetical protein
LSEKINKNYKKLENNYPGLPLLSESSQGEVGRLLTNKPYTLTELILISRCRQIYDTDAGVSQSQSSL